MMNVYYLTFRSVTPAQRGENLLRKMGFRCAIQRTPRWMEEKGCGYCLQVPEEWLREALELLRSSSVNFRKVYTVSGVGDAREVRI